MSKTVTKAERLQGETGPPKDADCEDDTAFSITHSKRAQMRVTMRSDCRSWGILENPRQGWQWPARHFTLTGSSSEQPELLRVSLSTGSTWLFCIQQMHKAQWFADLGTSVWHWLGTNRSSDRHSQGWQKKLKLTVKISRDRLKVNSSTTQLLSKTKTSSPHRSSIRMSWSVQNKDRKCESGFGKDVAKGLGCGGSDKDSLGSTQFPARIICPLSSGKC